MAKISLLPALNNPDGTELVPVVKGGKTMRASVAGLVAGAVAGTVDNLKVDATAYIGRPGDAALVDGTPTGMGSIYWHDTVDDVGSVIAVDVFDRAAGTVNLASYRGPVSALARVALTSFKTTGTRTSRRIMLAEPIPVRAGDILAVQPTTAGVLTVAEVQSGDIGYTYSAPYLPEAVALDPPTTNGQVQVRFVIAYRKQVVTADTFLASTAVKIVGPRAVALSSDVNPRGYVEWATTGQPTGHLVKWGNYTATLDGKAQRMEFPNFSLAQPYAFIGNSLTDSTDTKDRWSQVLAARYGQLMISVARYSSDWRMVYRVGAKAIVLTLAGALPAAGTVAVSKINGAAIDGNNPAAFLTTGDPGVVSGMAMSGYLTRNGVTRRATVSAPNGASFAYVVTQAPGQTAITFDGPVTFVPDFALSVPGRICVIWLGNNYFFSGVANAYGDFTNPQMWGDLKLIVAFLQARGCRVLLIPLIPSANTAEGDNWLARGAGTPYTAMESANARTEAMFPGLVARHADGRTFLKFLQDRNDGSPEALDDVAKGFTPRNLRRKPDGSYDLLHMYGDGTGDLAVADFVDSALQAQALPSAITQTTDFIITALGADGQLPDTAIARVSRDTVGDLADRVANFPLVEAASAIVQGIYPATDGTQSLAVGLTAFSQIPFSQSGILGSLSFRVAAAAPDGILCIVEVNTDGTVRLVNQKPAALVAGLNSVRWPVAVTKGQFFAVYTPNTGCRYSITNPVGLYFTAGLPGTTASGSTAKAVRNDLTLRAGWTIETPIVARIRAAEDVAAQTSGQLLAQASAIAINAGTTLVQGAVPAVVNGAVGAGYTYAQDNTAFSAGGFLTQVRFWSGAAVSVSVLLISVSAGTARVEAVVPTTTVAGMNTVAMNMRVQAGWLVAIHCPATNSLNYFASAGANVLRVDGLAGGGVVGGTSAIAVSNANLALAIETTVLTGLLGENTAAGTAEAALKGMITSGGSTIFGPNPPAPFTPNNYLAAGYTMISRIPTGEGVLQSVSFYCGAAGAATLVLASSADGSAFTLLASKSVPKAVAGLNTVAWTMPTTPGMYVGVYTAAAGINYGPSDGSGVGFRYINGGGLPGVASPSTGISNGRCGISFTIITGLTKRLANLESIAGQAPAVGADAAVAGIGLLGAADPTGVADATAVFAAAAAAHPTPYVPAGTYAVTVLPMLGAGFWGPGIVLVNGVRYPLPARPRDGTLLLDLRSSMARLIASGSPFVLIADSLGAHFTASKLPKHWLNKFEDFVNSISAPGSEPSSSVFLDHAGTNDTAAFYGVTTVNGTALDAGPLGKAVTLADGGYIEVTGIYSTVEVFYNQKASGGTLTRTFNGAAAGAALATAGALTDQLSAFGPTGQVASGTYRFTATGGTVDVTTLQRLAPALPAPAPRALRVMRMAFGGYSTDNNSGSGFTDARLDSIVAQAKAIGPEPEYLIALLTNDMLFGSTAAILWGSVTNGSNVLTGLAVTDDIAIGTAVTGNGIAGATVAEILSPTSVRLNVNATATTTTKYGFAVGRATAYSINLRRMIRRLRAKGSPSRLGFLTPTRPDFEKWKGYYAAGEDLDTYLAIVLRVTSQEGGAYLIRTDQIDFNGAGMLVSDGLHWGDPAQDKVLSLAVTKRADIN